MAFCGKCGTMIGDGIKFCPSCGADMSPQPENTYQDTQQQDSSQSDFSNKIADLNNTADTTGDFDQADINQNKIMGVLAYLSWLVLIPIFAAPKSKFARYHANQGLVLAIVEIIWWIIQAVLSSVFFSISWRLGFLSTILSLVNILFLVLAIIGIVNAANGKAKELPVIGKFRILK